MENQAELQKIPYISVLLWLTQKLRFLAGGQEILRSKQNFGRTPAHEPLFALIYYVEISEF
jgi:hypothetical protein